MKKVWIVLALCIGAVIATALVGCQKSAEETPATPATAVEEAEKEAGAAEHPAADKPKDHPAH